MAFRSCQMTGNYRKKFQVRAAWKSFLFIGALTCAAIYNTFSQEEEGSFENAGLDSNAAFLRVHRALDDECDKVVMASPKWLLVFYIIGVLYMFLALAIVCDEFFVPALEEMSSSRRMNLSMDVAGATLMAAGGSAPELFSSFFGTFNRTEIGFGTIIGSAAFNVLFVISMCSVFSKDILALTWWPLFRDIVYYAVGIVVLCIFVGVSSEGEIEVWEAIILFLMYLGYIVIMWQNSNIYKAITGKEWVDPEDLLEEQEMEQVEAIVDEFDEAQESKGESPMQEISATANPQENAPGNIDIREELSTDEMKVDEEKPEDLQEGRQSYSRRLSSRSLKSTTSSDTLHKSILNNQNFDFRWQGTFRAGILKLLRSPASWAETGGVGIVAKIDGDADQVFRRIDANHDGKIDSNELKRLFEALGHKVTEDDLADVFNALDDEGTGAITQEKFRKWYTNSEELLRSQVRQVFDSLDTDHSGTIDRQELMFLLIQLDPQITDDDVNGAIEAMYQSGSKEEITFEEFSEWYTHSIAYERRKQRVEDDMKGAWDSLKPPFGESLLSWLQFIVIAPLVLVLAVTIPDVRIPGRGKWCYVSFFLSISWIGAFSYFMVEWAETIGNTAGIPSVIMGLTVLAAGTSVPDLLSSVIVARRGSGDMAVSSSIGSNIFDILVGLPIPWIIFTAWPSTPSIVSIGTDNIFFYLLILLAMLLFVLVSVHCQGWRLTKGLGGLMILGYIAFLAIAIILEVPFPCVSG